MLTKTTFDQLSEEQQEAVKLIEDFLKDPFKEEFVLGGLAGTGKSYLINYLYQNLSMPLAVCSFTNKAALNLRRKGIHSAKTIHKLMYNAVYNEEEKKWKYFRVAELPVSLIIIDEGSVVNKILYDDLCSYGTKRLIFGDNFQLEPVGSNPNLMENCDFILSEIHRQAAENPIVQLAHGIRNNMNIPSKFNSELLKIESKDKLNHFLQENDYDIIICGKNKTRHSINAIIRKKLGFDINRYINVDEKIIALQNNKENQIFNGNIFTIKDIAIYLPEAKRAYVNLEDEDGCLYRNIYVNLTFFGHDNKENAPNKDKKLINFDYGYAITCHKSQGSEWESVLAVDEPVWGCTPERWQYTIVTRARTKLTYLI